MQHSSECPGLGTRGKNTAGEYPSLPKVGSGVGDDVFEFRGVIPWLSSEVPLGGDGPAEPLPAPRRPENGGDGGSHSRNRLDEKNKVFLIIKFQLCGKIEPPDRR